MSKGTSGKFAGKTALVTGSTSGIGLGIASAFAAEGADIVINGFGDAAQIEALRTDLAQRRGVSVQYDAAASITGAIMPVDGGWTAQ